MTNTGSPPADLNSACAQIGISSAPSPGSPGDRSKAAAETNPPFHNTEGDQTESDDIMRVLGLDLVPLAIAKVPEKRRKREELAKETAQNEADLGLLEGWLDEKFPHDWWDPHAVATKTSAAPAPSAADPIGDSARPAQERPPANNQSEAPGQLENGGQRALGRPPFVNPETFKILTKSDPVEPPTALDPQPPPIQSATQPRDRKRDGGYQQRRVKWALDRLGRGRNLTSDLNIANITRAVGRMLASQEAREAAMFDGGAPSWNTVDRALGRPKKNLQ